MTPPLSRPNLAAAGRDSAAAPVRIVHFGLGAFHRAHQAWYTQHARDRDQWGIAAFTGRSDRNARLLDAQDGLYTLVRRGAGGDTSEVVTSIVQARPGSDLPALIAAFSRPELAIATITVTERGYRLAWDGGLDREDAGLTADLAGLASEPFGGFAPTTLLGRLLLGLDARRRARLPGIAVVPCDNVPDNGRFLSTGLLQAAAEVDTGLAAWISAEVSFVSTSVDRITPRTTAADVAAVNRDAPFQDAAPVITEPFTDWVLSGDFPAGRPCWEDAGARFTADIEPWERRKLWMLNGAHTMLANGGLALGHETVAGAMGDPRLREMVDALWDEAAAQLPAEVEPPAYAEQLRTRFANPRIEHRLAQIAADSAAKLKLRIIPVAVAERAAGRPAGACAFAVACWAAASVVGDVETAVHALSPVLAADGGFVDAVRRGLDELGRRGAA
ncbi:mannitol dehydrogenase family protein [Allonocardiopsis opalescens]|uniref:Mannitol-1-phosphate 5-dehydrogenase n=1 Tax=Allonocardiopsis opalescens TaxID=1144618 RepID=A0A2T0PYF7_9ACTN|nr:mannitol dehydrogenase family protein [Allonocardiopsis opalescens]PRX96554.1 fructuronate reductase [Allonocardiopsis opalescens]